MKDRISYSYSILRYVHDIAAAEFINVGVAIHAHEPRYFHVQCRKTLGRITETFPDVAATSFKALMKMIVVRFEQESLAYNSPMDFGGPSASLKTLIYSVIPKDDSSLTWSEIGTGITTNVEKALTKLYARFVGKYDNKISKQGRTDDDVWRSFKKDLENRQIAKYFDVKTIQGKDDEIKFPLAWKNGVWHCVEPISFDLAAAESIRDKAHKFIGQIASVNDAKEKFKLYLIIGKPHDQSLENSFERVLRLLQRLPDTEIFMEDQKPLLIDKFATEIAMHEATRQTSYQLNIETITQPRLLSSKQEK